MDTTGQEGKRIGEQSISCKEKSVMRRIITLAVASCLAMFCFVMLIIGISVKRNPQNDTPLLREDNSSRPTSNQALGSTEPKKIPDPTEPKAMASSVFALPVRIAFFGDGQFSPCYFDVENKTLYRWKGVVLRREQVPHAGPKNRIPVLNAKDYSVVLVEAPVKYWYWEDGEGYRPGYLDQTTRSFYAWKGIVLNKRELLEKRQDGQDVIVKPAFARQVIEVIEIDMPAHLKEKPRLWTKNGTYDPEAAGRAEKKAAERKAAGERADRAAAEKRAHDPQVFQLGVVIAYSDKGENRRYSPCYYDWQHSGLFTWKGVILRFEQLPVAYKEGKAAILPVEGCTIVPIEPPVKYRETADGYRPGYLDHTVRIFYEWKGIVLKKAETLEKSKDGQAALVAPDKFSQVIEIDMPAHLKEQPKLWKKKVTLLKIPMRSLGGMALSLAAILLAAALSSAQQIVEENPFYLRADERLQCRVQVKPDHPKLGDIVAQLRNTTGLDLTIAESLQDHDPDFGYSQPSKQGYYAWQIMELVASKDLQSGYWEKTECGYRLLGYSQRRQSTAPRNSPRRLLILYFGSMLIVLVMAGFRRWYAAKQTPPEQIPSENSEGG